MERTFAVLEDFFFVIELEGDVASPHLVQIYTG